MEQLLSTLRRRWILTCLLLLLTLAGTATAAIKLPKTYQSHASVLFLASQSASKTVGNNPYMAFNSTLNDTADAVRYETMDGRTAQLLAAQGYSSSYLVADAVDTNGPVLNITITGSDKTAVEHTLYGVTSEIQIKLSGLQAGIANKDKIRETVVTFAPTPTVLSSKKARPLAGVFALGLILTIGIPLIVDAALVRRRRLPDTGHGTRVTPSPIGLDLSVHERLNYKRPGPATPRQPALPAAADVANSENETARTGRRLPLAGRDPTSRDPRTTRRT